MRAGQVSTRAVVAVNWPCRSEGRPGAIRRSNEQGELATDSFAHPSLWHRFCMDARPASTRQPPLKARKKDSTHTRPAIFSPLDAICRTAAGGRKDGET